MVTHTMQSVTSLNHLHSQSQDKGWPCPLHGPKHRMGLEGADLHARAELHLQGLGGDRRNNKWY